MKSIHLGVSLCLNLLVLYTAKAQTTVTWSILNNTEYTPATNTIKALQGNNPCVIGSNSIAANTNGWVKFTLQANAGQCFVAYGLGEQGNSPNHTLQNTYSMTVMGGGVNCYYAPNNSWSSSSGCSNGWVNNGDAAGTEIKIERIGSIVNYYHNNVLKCSKSISAGITLVPIITFFSNSEAGKSVKVLTEVSQPGVGIAVPAVEYTYDDAGNRVRRRTVTVILPRASKQEEEPITFSDFKLKVFPNPSDGHFEVTVEGDTDGLSFDVFDMAGKHLHKEPVAGMNTSINVSHLATGMYILTCRDAQKIKGQWKLMIQ
jgi:Secretion system C-terminal sorting domain